MAPFNLEDNIREKLENRELNPSQDAWKKLETQLDKTPRKKKSVGWYYVAASVVGLLMAVSIFYNGQAGGENNQLVKEIIPPSEKTHTKVEIVSETNELNKGQQEKEISDRKMKTEKAVKPIPPQKPSAIDKKIKTSDRLANRSEMVEAKEPKTDLESVVVNEEKFNAKVEEVVAAVKFLEKSNKEVTLNEVDALLNNARREIETDLILKNSKVDATALLEEVEWELEKSFRDKVFDALGDGFKKIRTAVLERNN